MEENETKIASKEVQDIYLSFYTDLIPKVFDFNEKTFTDKVRGVPRACHIDNLENTSRPWLEFDKAAVRCAYLLRYSVLNVISLAEHFFKAITFGSDMLDRLLAEDTLKIVCFGGGSGSEIVSIVKTINDYLNQCEEELKSDALQICFTVLDKYDEWQVWTTSLVKHLRCNNSICSKRKVDIRLRFYAIDLSEDWNENTVKAVKKADVLTMVKFISAYCVSMSEKKYNEKKDLELLTKIAQTMKLDARIFFLDYAGGRYYHKVEKYYEKYQFLEKVTTYLHQSHQVNISVFSKGLLKGCPLVNREMLGKHNTKISSCLWLKCIPKARFVKNKKKNGNKNMNIKKKYEKKFPEKPDSVTCKNGF